MNIPKIFLHKKVLLEEIVKLDLEQIHYLRNVLRLKNGEKIEIYDGQGGKSFGIFGDSKKESLIQINEILSRNVEQYPKITLAFAPIKGDYLFHALRMATEMGVRHFIPIITERCVRRNWPKKRCLSIIEHACLQSEQPYIPEFNESIHLFELLQAIESPSCKIIGVPRIDTHPYDFEHFLPASNSQTLLILVGPEGGFTAEEGNWALSHDFFPVNISDTILRADTAIIAMITFANILRKISFVGQKKLNKGEKHV